MTVRTRYAPSPTGQLHIGGARTALFNYLYAKRHGGEFILRFEDTDQARHVDSAESKQMEGLKWLGLNWNEGPDIGGSFGPYKQTERLDLYRTFVDRLIANGDAYECFCTDEDNKANGLSGYTGKCRDLTPEEKELFLTSGKKPSIRFRVPTNTPVGWNDEIRGRVEFNTKDISDFVIVRANGIPMYNFAAVIDDHLMSITHVIRGEEHLSNTPKQILLYRALGLNIPVFAHIPLILNADGKKMSKRDETTLQFIEQYKELGFVPEAVVNFLSLLGWSPAHENEIISLDGLTEQFDLDRVNKSPAVFDPVKFTAINAEYLKNVPYDQLLIDVIPHLQSAGFVGTEMTVSDVNFIGQFVKFHRHIFKKLSDAPTLAKKFYTEDVEFTSEAIETLNSPNANTILEKFLEVSKSHEGINPETYKVVVSMVQKDLGLKAKEVFSTIRAALIGDVHGLDIGQTIFLLGPDKTRGRIIKSLK